MIRKKDRESNSFKTLALAWVMTSLLAILFSSPAMAQLYDWTRLDPKYVPPGRDDHMMAFDSHLGRVVMFGGDKGSNATWIFDGETWRDLGLTEVPAPRREAAMVYDSKRRKIVMFGGYDYTYDSDLIWEFDGEAWAGSIPGDDGPQGRSDHAMAFDEERGVCVMYGGNGQTGETWSYDGEKWEVIAEADDGPGERWGHSMAYDANRKVVVMFGGYLDEYYNDTWEWDGTSWKKITTENAPMASRDHAMVFDSARNVIVLFGGRNSSSTGTNETWEYDGTNWIQRGPTDSAPGVRHEVAAAFDSWRNKVIIFGGSTGDSEDNRWMNDTWWYPNVPPMVEHTPEIAVSPDDDLSIRAKVVDLDQDSINVSLYYRMKGDASFKSAVMTLANDRFIAVVPAADLNKGMLQYYIKASDPQGSGSSAYGASASKPFEVIVDKYGLLKVNMDTKVARKRGARWSVVGTDEWYKSGTELDVKPGTYEITFSRVEGFKKPGKKTVVVERGFLTFLKVAYKNKKKL